MYPLFHMPLIHMVYFDPHHGPILTDSSPFNSISSDIDLLMQNLFMDLLAITIHKERPSPVGPIISHNSTINFVIRQKCIGQNGGQKGVGKQVAKTLNYVDNLKLYDVTIIHFDAYQSLRLTIPVTNIPS